MRLVAFIAVAVTGALLLFASEDFPDWADADSPASASPVSRHFIEQTYNETKVPNLVTAVLADYRGYDTMLETVVVFIAGIAIIAILRFLPTDGDAPVRRSKADDVDIIVEKTCRIVIPVMQLFALYVIGHGHHSPGGGFQGGVIFGASLILLAVATNLNFALTRLPERKMIVLAVAGVVIYAGFGVASMWLGRNFLDYGILSKIMPADEVMARSHSMLGVEVGVAFTVATIMFAIYANLATRGRMQGGL